MKNYKNQLMLSNNKNKIKKLILKKVQLLFSINYLKIIKN